MLEAQNEPSLSPHLPIILLLRHSSMKSNVMGMGDVDALKKATLEHRHENKS